MMKRIGIILANHYRQAILEICFAGIDRLRADCIEDIPVVCIGEEDDKTLDLCKHYDIEHHYAPNIPLTGKYNYACQLLRTKVDAVMVIGSDNLISNNTFMRISDKVQEGFDLIGADDIYFMCLDDVHAGKLLYFGRTTVLGVGRTISAQILDKVNWTPWGIPRDRGIDRVMLDTVRPHVEKSILLSGCYIFDLKSNQNLNNVNSWVKSRGYMDSAEIFWNSISPAEQNLITNLLNN